METLVSRGTGSENLSPELKLSHRNEMQVILALRKGASTEEEKRRVLQENSPRFREFIKDPQNRRLILNYLETRDEFLVLKIEDGLEKLGQTN